LFELSWSSYATASFPSSSAAVLDNVTQCHPAIGSKNVLPPGSSVRLFPTAPKASGIPPTFNPQSHPLPAPSHATPPDHPYHAPLSTPLPMSSAAFARIARARLASTPCRLPRPATRVQLQAAKPAAAAFSTRTTGLRADHDAHDPHGEESFEEFTAR